MAPDDDATVRLSPAVAASLTAPEAAPPHRHGRRALICGLCLGAAGAAGGAWWWSRRAAGPMIADIPDAPPAVTPPAAVLPPEGPPLLDRAALLAHRARVPTAMRWSANPLVWVLDFPSLDAQGQAMNRAAALLEKARTPRDRVLDDQDLAAAIRADRRTPANWYFGHNYRGSDLVRLFTLAAQAELRLNPQEAWVAEQLALSRQIDASRDTAFLTVVAEGDHVDAAIRDSVLLHELGHGQFFTMPFFAAHVVRVWERGFQDAERAAIRRFLAEDGYDTTQEELMANEAMAYLLYTPDRRFFDPARDLGWSDAQADTLRAMLRAGAPAEP
ncbi:hypothetical protein ACQW02_14000 [Humitalea sp. 24SJ18S-53]|uniref:hypothetical protein n=1 Tax=Humitalea sp. 24SJ18S-53 TaxID=3422307 RepID=UPI003D675B97